jgi:hypothetical protein
MIAQISWAERAVVLVVDRDSPIEQLSTLDIRKAYLGIIIDVDGRNIRPLRSRDDEELNQIFLQAVIAMTSRTYERRLLSSALKYGRPRPREARNRNELIELIANSPISIAYMWKSDAESDSRVKIVRVLWQEL